jgi:hypothetical protein
VVGVVGRVSEGGREGGRERVGDEEAILLPLRHKFTGEKLNGGVCLSVCEREREKKISCV